MCGEDSSGLQCVPAAAQSQRELPLSDRAGEKKWRRGGPYSESINPEWREEEGSRHCLSGVPFLFSLLMAVPAALPRASCHGRNSHSPFLSLDPSSAFPAPREGRAPTTDQREPGPPSPAVTLDLEVNSPRPSRQGGEKAIASLSPASLKGDVLGLHRSNFV